MNKKIIITGVSDIDKTDLAKLLTTINDNLSITPHFTTDIEMKNSVTDKYIYYLDSNIVNLSYKNNALLITDTENYITTGVTIDDFYNNDILCTDLKDFNNIIEQCFINNDIVIVWLDTVNKDIRTKSDIIETKYLCDRINKGTKYLYFLDCDQHEICDVILQYYNGNDEVKSHLLEKFS